LCRADRFGPVEALNEDTRYLSGGVPDRIVGKVDEGLCRLTLRLRPDHHPDALAGKAAAFAVDLIQHFEETLPFDFRDGGANRAADGVAPTDETGIAVIDEGKDVIGSLQHRDHARRLAEQAAEFLGLRD